MQSIRWEWQKPICSPTKEQRCWQAGETKYAHAHPRDLWPAKGPSPRSHRSTGARWGTGTQMKGSEEGMSCLVPSQDSPSSPMWNPSWWASGRFVPRGMAPVGCRGSHRDHYSIFRGGTRGRERGGLRWFGEEQLWGKWKGKGGWKGPVTCNLFAGWHACQAITVPDKCSLSYPIIKLSVFVQVLCGDICVYLCCIKVLCACVHTGNTCLASLLVRSGCGELWWPCLCGAGRSGPIPLTKRLFMGTVCQQLFYLKQCLASWCMSFLVCPSVFCVWGGTMCIVRWEWPYSIWTKLSLRQILCLQQWQAAFVQESVQALNVVWCFRKMLSVLQHLEVNGKLHKDLISSWTFTLRQSRSFGRQYVGV